LPKHQGRRMISLRERENRRNEKCIHRETVRYMNREYQEKRADLEEAFRLMAKHIESWWD
jgi:hypothetical protein